MSRRGGVGVRKSQCLVHESLHFLSANHTGFQTLELDNLNVHAKGGTAIAHSLDEAVTERLSREVAGNVLGTSEAYTTNYWNMEARRGLDFQRGLHVILIYEDLLIYVEADVPAEY